MENSQKSQCRVTIHIQGKDYETFSEGRETILDVALRLGADPPYSCMTGSCSSCLARLNEGEVRCEDTRDQLILTCQAFVIPECPRVKVSYDEKD